MLFQVPKAIINQTKWVKTCCLCVRQGVLLHDVMGCVCKCAVVEELILYIVLICHAEMGEACRPD